MTLSLEAAMKLESGRWYYIKWSGGEVMAIWSQDAAAFFTHAHKYSLLDVESAIPIPQPAELAAIREKCELVPELVEGLADCMCCYQPGSSTYVKLQNLLLAAKAALGE